MANVTPLAAGNTVRTSASAATESTATTGTSGLGKQDFLKLLVAQLKNQDPLRPMEDKEFIAQLAQFSSLEALQSLEARIDSMAKASELTQTSGLIGKTVKAELPDGSTVEGVVGEVRLFHGKPQLMVGIRAVDMDYVVSVHG